jgi:hypothetical protein
MTHVLTLEIEGGHRFYIIVRAESEKSVFGVDPKELPLVMDTSINAEIPAVLLSMKKHLYERNALAKQGIFRTPGDESEIVQVKEELNRGTFTSCSDIHCVSTLIKVEDLQ